MRYAQEEVNVKDDALLERCREFLKTAERVAIVHHGDADSISSAAMAHALMTYLGKDIVDMIALNATEHRITQDTVDKVTAAGATHVITVDFCADSDATLLAQLGTCAKVLVIDHHQVVNPDLPEVIVAKPQLLFDKVDGAKFPTSALCYVLFKQLADERLERRFAWLASIGILGDSAYPKFTEFVDAAVRRQGLVVKDSARKTPFNRVIKLINFANATGLHAVREACNVVCEADSYKDILNALQKHSQVGKEIERFFHAFEDNAEHHDTLHIFKIDSSFDIGSNLSTAISFNKCPDEAVIVVQELDDCIRIHGRRQDGKIDMARLLQDATATIEGANAGGHVPAAGASIPKSAYNTFKKQLIAVYG